MLLLKRLTSKRVLPLLWTFLTIVLLCLPGSAIPGNGLFSIPNLDKVVHMGLFGGITLLWSFYYWQLQEERPGGMRKIGWLAAFFAIALGVILEFMQKHLIPNRSFDAWDMVADAAGALLALLLFWLTLRADNKIN